MGRYQGGDADAVRELFHALQPGLLAYLSGLSLNRSTAEDLVQETFLAVHRSRHTYLSPRPVKPWVFAIARHVFLMERRSSGRRHKLETSCAVSDVLFSAEVQALADREWIERALARLLPQRRESLLLHHALGFSFAEIGKILGIRSGTAKLRAYRRLQDLRAQLEKTDDVK